MHILATSDSSIVAGLIALLLRVYGDRRPADILATPPDFIRQIQLDEHLSPTRSNGLAAMVQQIRQMAVEALSQQLRNA
jgi:cysteine desulfuration protein SufE